MAKDEKQTNVQPTDAQYKSSGAPSSNNSNPGMNKDVTAGQNANQSPNAQNPSAKSDNAYSSQSNLSGGQRNASDQERGVDQKDNKLGNTNVNQSSGTDSTSGTKR